MVTAALTTETISTNRDLLIKETKDLVDTIRTAEAEVDTAVATTITTITTNIRISTVLNSITDTEASTMAWDTNNKGMVTIWATLTACSNSNINNKEDFKTTTTARDVAAGTTTAATMDCSNSKAVLLPKARSNLLVCKDQTMTRRHPEVPEVGQTAIKLAPEAAGVVLPPVAGSRATEEFVFFRFA